MKKKVLNWLCPHATAIKQLCKSKTVGKSRERKHQWCPWATFLSFHRLCGEWYSISFKILFSCLPPPHLTDVSNLLCLSLLILLGQLMVWPIKAMLLFLIHQLFRLRKHPFPLALRCWGRFALVKCCVHLRTSSSKTQMLVLEKTIFHKYWLFC